MNRREVLKKAVVATGVAALGAALPVLAEPELDFRSMRPMTDAECDAKFPDYNHIALDYVSVDGLLGGTVRMRMNGEDFEFTNGPGAAVWWDGEIINLYVGRMANLLTDRTGRPFDQVLVTERPFTASIPYVHFEDFPCGQVLNPTWGPGMVEHLVELQDEEVNRHSA